MEAERFRNEDILSSITTNILDGVSLGQVMG